MMTLMHVFRSVSIDRKDIHMEELHDFCFSPNIRSRVMKYRMRWARHVLFMGRREMHVGFWLGHLKETDHLEDLVIGERVVLKLMHKEM
jgi:hypothetical protein